jgi:valine--pyruvate aminotransferase
MTKHFSTFGQRFLARSGTRQLMDDLGQLQRSTGEFRNLGGGNPSRIGEIHEWFATKLAALAAGRALDDVFAAYDDPQGNHAFIVAVSRFLGDYFEQTITSRNIVCTPGSQASFFMLFNLFAGVDPSGRQRRILLPQSPEYIGYSGLTFEPDMLQTHPSKISFTAPHRFKYEIDFDNLIVNESIGAICLSRPTNPTGNVVSDSAIARLATLAAEYDIPLIVDCAYGEPFPGILFAPGRMTWSENMILCFSLSKLGLPGLRTGIVLADAEIIRITRLAPV